MKACHIYARALSCALWPFDLSIRLHGLESIYLILIFLLYSILTLCSKVRTSDPIEYRFIQMVLTTLTNWLDSSLMSCIDQTSYLRHYNMRLLDCISSIRGLVHACVVSIEQIFAISSCMIYILLPLGFRWQECFCPSLSATSISVESSFLYHFQGGSARYARGIATEEKKIWRFKIHQWYKHWYIDLCPNPCDFLPHLLS